MIKLEQRQIKIFSVVIALVFVGSVVALALTQLGGAGIASAASTNIGVIDYQQAMSSAPGASDVPQQMQLAVEEARKEFESKSAGMQEEEKAAYYQQTQERLQKKQQDLVEPIQKKVDAAIKSVAESKGLTVVVYKAAVAYGGNDITQDVIRKLK